MSLINFAVHVREGAIDRLIGLYKNCLPRIGVIGAPVVICSVLLIVLHIQGFLTKDGTVNLKLVQMIMKGMYVLQCVVTIDFIHDY